MSGHNFTVFCLILGLLGNGSGQAAPCNPEACKLPDCRCSGTDIPGGFQANEIPQIVLLTYDDAVTIISYDSYYAPALFNRTNPNGCPISATFYTTHDYADYSRINELHRRGHEIALHSITHESNTDMWRNASYEFIVSEFVDQIDMLAKFALIPKEDISGVRLPFLQLPGNNLYAVLNDYGISYDCSWPTQKFMDPGMWPYTLDYASTQDCPIGPCPTKSYPGTWVVPMIEWEGNDGHTCSMTDACSMPEEVDAMLDIFKANFLHQYNGNRAPFGIYLHSAWFMTNPDHFLAYQRFLDYVSTLPDVYLVSVAQAVDWVKNPVPLTNATNLFPCTEPQPSACVPTTCAYTDQSTMPPELWPSQRYWTQCDVQCPPMYPWRGNPLGEKVASNKLRNNVF